MILMLITYQSLKKNNTANMIHLNTLLGIMRPLYLFISQTTGYINKFEKNIIIMSLAIKDKQL